MSAPALRRLAAWLTPPQPRAAFTPGGWRRAWAQASPARKAIAALGVVLILAAALLRHEFFIVTPLHAMTESLPERWFFVRVAPPEAIRYGDYLAFRWAGPVLPAGATLIKQVAGLPGDTVIRVPGEGGTHDFYVNGKHMGTAKARSRSGERLAPGPAGTIPAGHYYVMGTHADSLDSRYALAGWIPAERLIGRAHPLSLP